MSTSKEIGKVSPETKHAETALHVGKSIESLESHKIICYGNEIAPKVLPDDTERLHQINSTITTWFVPLVFYLNTEARLVHSHTCASATNARGQMKMEKHIPSGYAFIIFERGGNKV